ncbi:MAG: PIN domain-containing protein [Thermoanaerobaculia bacterium]
MPPPLERKVPLNRRLLFDRNVVLDVLLERRPHVGTAAGFGPGSSRVTRRGLFRRAALRRFTIWRGGPREHDSPGKRSPTSFRVVAVNEETIRRALDLSGPDFEDAVCVACAEAAHCDAIVSRDPSGFRNSPVEVIDPVTALAWLNIPRR